MDSLYHNKDSQMYVVCEFVGLALSRFWVPDDIGCCFL